MTLLLKIIMQRKIVTVTNILACIENIGHSHNLTMMLSQIEKGRRPIFWVAVPKYWSRSQNMSHSHSVIV